MNQHEELLTYVGELDPGVTEETPLYNVHIDGSTLHGTKLGDPLALAILDALGSRKRCHSGDPETALLSHRQLDEYKLCPECLQTPYELLSSVNDDELREALMRLREIPVLRPTSVVARTIVSETCDDEQPLSHLVRRYALLRQFVNVRISENMYEVADHYQPFIDERVNRTRTTLDELHSELLGGATFPQRLLAEHHNLVVPAGRGNCIVVVAPLDGCFPTPGGVGDPKRTADLDAGGCLADLLQVVLAPRSLEEECAVIVPVWAPAVIEQGPVNRVRLISECHEDEVLDTALRLYDPLDPTSIYSDLTTCVRAAERLRA
jgi:hypothetical protein